MTLKTSARPTPWHTQKMTISVPPTKFVKPEEICGALILDLFVVI